MLNCLWPEFFLLVWYDQLALSCSSFEWLFSLTLLSFLLHSSSVCPFPALDSLVMMDCLKGLYHTLTLQAPVKWILRSYYIIEGRRNCITVFWFCPRCLLLVELWVSLFLALFVQSTWSVQFSCFRCLLFPLASYIFVKLSLVPNFVVFARAEALSSFLYWVDMFFGLLISSILELITGKWACGSSSNVRFGLLGIIKGTGMLCQWCWRVPNERVCCSRMLYFIITVCLRHIWDTCFPICPHCFLPIISYGQYDFEVL